MGFGIWSDSKPSPGKLFREGYWNWTILAILRIAFAQNDVCFQNSTLLDCRGASITVPYCLQCTDCFLRCGGPNVHVPWCYPCEDECVTPPTNTNPQFLGEDGKPFVVNISELNGLEAESEGREVDWAGNVKWNYVPKITESLEAALCWGFKDSFFGNMTYQCVIIQR
ncbi:hypothetical protein N7495_004795 [Penicillium taxi]|uniref:uncharacterized protein n=1 Tax=Penicillium taxi TaxID=168475 RepID=UPI0025458137|nr:uncharacterized protein N7495_004795 [Penicillium taxi]KAJ5900051.1 hypothetical protein N7495_004795 [Penicillium taxi]